MPVSRIAQACTGQIVEQDGQVFYRICHYDQIPPFFITVVSPGDHWLFISSTGGLSAGRRCADNALFPYETEDKLSQNFASTGSKTAVWAGRQLWEPFMPHTSRLYRIQRNLYKSSAGDQLIFVEHNFDLGLRLCVLWAFSKEYGIVRQTSVQSKVAQQIRILDGVQNILPAGASQVLQNQMSNLLDAYKKSEQYDNLLAVYALSAILSDRAEPSESLLATTLWCDVDGPARLLLCRDQLATFLQGAPLQDETQICGRAGAYLLEQQLSLAAGTEVSWCLAAELEQSHADIRALQQELQDKQTLRQRLATSLVRSGQELRRIVAAADGIQYSADALAAQRHFANTLFNTMRGGFFPYGYRILLDDLRRFAQRQSPQLAEQLFGLLPAGQKELSTTELRALCDQPDLLRLCYEYLPLSFSRRHGDPSRPWNQFCIDVRESDGSSKLCYQGNWRDIFQNWEALAFSYPKFIQHIIAKFLNASSADGYNPYRISSEGIDWEVPEAENPWANIGYWGDHQLIYLLKLLECSWNFDPAAFCDFARHKIFSYSDVPYRLRPFAQMVQNPKDTIVFDWQKYAAICKRQKTYGADAKLLWHNGRVYCVSFTEKLLVTLLAKLSNVIPASGIWLNTQRPEWNDANNALVGNGVSVVSLCYLRRFLAFCVQVYGRFPAAEFEVSQRVLRFEQGIFCALQGQDEQRMFCQLSQAGTDYREALYRQGADPHFVPIAKTELLAFLQLAQHKVEEFILRNRRQDGLFHSYNLVSFSGQSFATSHLYEMLEGQVAALSCGLLTGAEAIELVRALRSSALYREDQDSYMLYPHRQLPAFLAKNTFALPELLRECQAPLLHQGVITCDVFGQYHFCARYRNAADLQADIAAYPKEQQDALLELFEATFKHKEFTGRSGTFFAYEGLGSIYWHMVSKLLLAVGESVFAAEGEQQQQLVALYYQLRQGLGFNKTPVQQGAFPLDPYSHTPWGMGAKQPGMTGQVKEEILSRMMELGLRIKDGALYIAPALLRPEEFFGESSASAPDASAVACGYFDLAGAERELPPNSLCFTFCQVPFLYHQSAHNAISCHWKDGRTDEVAGLMVPPAAFSALQARSGELERIEVQLIISERE